MKKTHLVIVTSWLLVAFGLLAFVDKSNNIKTVSFTAKFTTSNEVLQQPPVIKQKITGTGSSDELSLTKFVALSTMDRTTAPPFKMEGTCTWYSSDGDTFTSAFTGKATPSAGGVMTLVISHTITGGTGKYAHATGTVSGKTIVDPAKLPASIDCNGTISW